MHKKMQKFYTTKSAMALDIQKLTGLGIEDIRSRLSRSDKPKEGLKWVEIDGHPCELFLYETPEKFLIRTESK